MPKPLSPSETRALLNSLDHRPVKKLGQNFLIDGNIVRKSLELAEIEAGDRVVEVGPGLGTLTRALLDAQASVYAVEKDPRLAAHLAQLESTYPKHFHLLRGDAISHPLANLSLGDGVFKIVANLPYAISTPWMELVIEGPLPDSLTLMLQKETAQRFTAKPGSKQFGSISIFLQHAFGLGETWDVAPSCFFPRPEVGSRLIHLKRRSDPFLFPKTDRELIRELFQQRRKQMASLLKKSVHPRSQTWLGRLELANIEPQMRPEQIELKSWKLLSESPDS
jgi:16S rRNA (adenine1518-N6/adenine1519-N6)-dimethyltransferase